MNLAQCKNCKTILWSGYRHDFQYCPCWTTQHFNRGIWIDGGDDYCRVGGHKEDYTPVTVLPDEWIEEHYLDLMLYIMAYKNIITAIYMEVG